MTSPMEKAFGTLTDSLREYVKTMGEQLKKDMVEVEVEEQDVASEMTKGMVPPPPAGLPSGHGWSSQNTFERLTVSARRPPSAIQRSPLPVSSGWNGTPEDEKLHQKTLQKGHRLKHRSVTAAIRKKMGG